MQECKKYRNIFSCVSFFFLANSEIHDLKFKIPPSPTVGRCLRRQSGVCSWQLGDARWGEACNYEAYPRSSEAFYTN
jgi:hypothetical protein